MQLFDLQRILLFFSVDACARVCVCVIVVVEYMLVPSRVSGVLFRWRCIIQGFLNVSGIFRPIPLVCINVKSYP